MPTHKPAIFVKQLAVGPMMNFAYLAGPAEGSEAILIDPSWDAPKLIDEAMKEGRIIKAIFATHTHFDHVNALEEAVEALSVPVYVHHAEANELDRHLEIKTTREGSTITIAGLTVRCLSTPGHSPGSQCFLIENVVFTGDTLFVEGCGRVDLEGGDPKKMVQSLKKLAELPEDTIVFPGHNYGGAPLSTIGEQKRSNPYMREGMRVLENA